MNKEKFEYYWSRKPGAFVDKTTGQLCTGASFHGSDREWCETLIEVIIDVHNSILRRREAKSLPPETDLMVTKPMMDVIVQSVLFNVGEPTSSGYRTGRIAHLNFRVLECNLPGNQAIGHFVIADGDRILASVQGMDF